MASEKKVRSLEKHAIPYLALIEQGEMHVAGSIVQCMRNAGAEVGMAWSKDSPPGELVLLWMKKGHVISTVEAFALSHLNQTKKLKLKLSTSHRNGCA